VAVAQKETEEVPVSEDSKKVTKQAMVA